MENRTFGALRGRGLGAVALIGAMAASAAMSLAEIKAARGDGRGEERLVRPRINPPYQPKRPRTAIDHEKLAEAAIRRQRQGWKLAGDEFQSLKNTIFSYERHGIRGPKWALDRMDMKVESARRQAEGA